MQYKSFWYLSSREKKAIDSCNFPDKSLRTMNKETIKMPKSYYEDFT